MKYPKRSRMELAEPDPDFLVDQSLPAAFDD